MPEIVLKAFFEPASVAVIGASTDPAQLWQFEMPLAEYADLNRLYQVLGLARQSASP